MNKTELQDAITNYLTQMANMLKADSAENRTSGNIDAEDFMCEFLNALDGMHFINANDLHRDMPGIDLIDEENMTIIQVSVSATRDKITHTFRELTNNQKLAGKFAGYTLRFCFPVLEIEANIRNPYTTCPEDINFDPEEDIINVHDLDKMVRSRVKSIAKLEELEKIAAAHIANRQNLAAIISDRLMSYAKMDANITLADRQKASSRITQSTQTQYVRNSRIHSFAVEGNEGALKELYIPLTLTEELSEAEKLDNKEPERHVIDAFPAELIEKHPHLLIVDTAGMGKSTLSKRIFLDLVDQGSERIPVLIELRNVDKKNPLMQEINRKTINSQLPLDQHILQNLIDQGFFFFIFDGYDEIPEDSLHEVDRDLRAMAESFVASQQPCIITSREATFSGFKRFNIQELEKEESYNLLRRFDRNGETSQQLITALEESMDKNIKEYLEVPLLVSLLYTSYRYKPMLPTRHTDFYEQVFTALYEKHDLSKGRPFIHDRKTGLRYDQFHSLFRFIAFYGEVKQRLTYNASVLSGIIQNAQQAVGLPAFDSRDFIYDITIAVPLFVREGNQYRWAHKSLREYFAALYIIRDVKDEERQHKILKNFAYGSDSFYLHMNLLKMVDMISHQTLRWTVTREVFHEYIMFCERERGVTIDSSEEDKLAASLLFLHKFTLVHANEDDPIKIAKLTSSTDNRFEFDENVSYGSNKDSTYRYCLFYSKWLPYLVFICGIYETLYNDRQFNYELPQKEKLTYRDYALYPSSLIIFFFKDIRTIIWYYKYDQVHAELKKIEQEIADSKSSIDNLFKL